MKVICIKKNLNRGLSITSRVISGGGTLPILNNILLKTDKGRLKLSSTNLEIAINTWVGGRVEEEGELTVPARLINDYINNLLTEKITISSEQQTLYLEDEKSKSHIKGLPADEFPLIPKVSETVYAKLDAGLLAQAISQVGFAAAFSETQPEISGVLFVFEGKTLTLAATDRYRLAEAKVSLTEPVAALKQIIVPSRATNEIRRVMSEGMVELYLSEGQVCFKSTDTELISRLIEGQYPDYQQIIPTNFATEAEMERTSLIQALKAASLFASENNNVEFGFDPQNKKVLIKAQAAQVGDSEISLEGELLGQKNTIIFNYRYLLECLGNLPDEKVCLKLINPSSPAEIVPVNRENYLYIVMPIKI